MLNSLNRFIEAQNNIYDIALSEIKSGGKESHWMWFIFPQFKGLGYSKTSQFYSIDSIEEAIDYLNHPILGTRLIEITKELLLLDDQPIEFIFGNPDDIKLQSCMTLFSEINESEVNIFLQVIDKYFKGKLDQNTLLLIQ